MPIRLAALVVALALSPAVLAGPRDDLLRVVPDDYTFCAVVQNLRDHAKGGSDTSFLKGIAEHPVLKGLQGTPEAAKFQRVFDGLMKDLMVTPEQFFSELFGDAVVFAYRKGPTGQEGKEDGLILVHARDEKLLARFVDRVNELQTKAGELKAVETIGAGAGEYRKRVKAVETEPSEYYALRGNRLAFSWNESLLKSTLAGLASHGTAEAPIARRMRQLGVGECPVSVLVNPRSFDADVAAGFQAGKGSEQAFVREFGRYWKAVDGLALFVNFRPAIEIGLSVNVRKSDLPRDAARFFTEAGKRSPLWDRIPDDALFAAVGRVHVESMAAMLGAFLTDPDRKKVLESIADTARPFLETEDFGPLARGIGPDVGLWVTAPEAGSKSWCPNATFAVKVGDGLDGQQAEQAALRGLDFLARLASLQHKGLRVQTLRQGSVEVRFLTHPSAFPPGFRPAFASKSGYVLAADSPETIARFEAPSTPAVDADEMPILRISATAWRRYLADHKTPLVEYLAGLKGTDPKELAGHIDSLLPILDGLDRLELVQRSGPDRAMLVVRLTGTRR